ncbi:MAG: hypothetical protein RLZZ324_1, partial [Candidatus Parcubacteria bacterium]
MVILSGFNRCFGLAERLDYALGERDERMERRVIAVL